MSHCADRSAEMCIHNCMLSTENWNTSTEVCRPVVEFTERILRWVCMPASSFWFLLSLTCSLVGQADVLPSAGHVCLFGFFPLKSNIRFAIFFLLCYFYPASSPPVLTICCQDSSLGVPGLKGISWFCYFTTYFEATGYPLLIFVLYLLEKTEFHRQRAHSQSGLWNMNSSFYCELVKLLLHSEKNMDFV